MNGRTRELDEEIERLSRKYGVLTPYTSFVEADDGSLAMDYQSTMSDTYTSAIPISERIKINSQIENDKITRSRRQNANTRYFGRKTFHRHGNMWVDIEYDGTSERQIVEFGSEAYYELMNDLPDLARYSKLAKDAITMIICYQGVNYEIIPPTV